VNHTPRCPYCGSPLEVYEGLCYCPDCLAYRPAEPVAPVTNYRDPDGRLWQPIATMPWSELTEGERYALPNDGTVHVRTATPATPTLWGGWPHVARAFANQQVILLAPAGDDPDRLVWIEDDPF
jgi:hypothetical protein